MQTTKKVCFYFETKADTWVYYTQYHKIMLKNIFEQVVIATITPDEVLEGGGGHSPDTPHTL